MITLELRHDPLLAVLCESEDALGKQRKRERDKGFGLAGKSTLNRLELTPVETDGKHRYKRIGVKPEKIDDLMTDIFLESYRKAPKEIILDVDATDDPLHGNQEGRFFHGYYGNNRCRSTFSVGSICCAHGFGKQPRTHRQGPLKKSGGSCAVSVCDGPG